MEMRRLTRDGTAEPVSRDEILRRERGQGNIIFPRSADHEQDWQPYPVDAYSCCMCDHKYVLYPITVFVLQYCTKLVGIPLARTTNCCSLYTLSGTSSGSVNHPTTAPHRIPAISTNHPRRATALLSVCLYIFVVVV